MIQTSKKVSKRPQIRVAIAGVGNCASALLQGLAYYKHKRNTTQGLGLITEVIGTYRASDIVIVAAFDVDKRKVGVQLEEAVFATPNCALRFSPILTPTDVTVKMGLLCDGVSPLMAEYAEERAFRVANIPSVDVAEELKRTGAEILICYLPVGADQDAKSYASACIDAGVSFINCMPAFIASDPEWGSRFYQKGIPIIGDDVKSQLGATIVHQVLSALVVDRGCRIMRTYQLNTGGNTDFLNMLDRSRLTSKITSKTSAVQSQFQTPLPESQIHVGPSDYIPWLNDNKVAYIRIEGCGFGGVPFEVDVKLSVQDSPNSAAVVVDLIRLAKIALDRKIGGPLNEICAYYMKRPPVQCSVEKAHEGVYDFLKQ